MMRESHNKQIGFNSLGAMTMFNEIRRHVLGWLRRRRLTNKNFSVICNNCFAGRAIYYKLDLPYSTPTVGLWFVSGDYIRFLENLRWYLSQPLVFTKVSRHPLANKLLMRKRYPIGVIGGDVEIQFVHYKSEKEAEEKWSRRAKRVNFDNLFLIYNDREGFEEEYLDRYEKLLFKNKIFFSSKPRDSETCIYMKEYAAQGQVGILIDDSFYTRHVDLVKWLNGTSFIKKKYKTTSYVSS